MAIDPGTAALIVAGTKLGLDEVGLYGSNWQREQALERAGMDSPWYWELAGLVPGIGTRAYSGYLGGRERELAESQALRQPASAGITAAAIKEMEASKRIMSEQVAGAIQQERISRAGRGVYASGERLTREQEIRQGGAAALATAMAQTGLRAEGLRQQGAALTAQTQMQQAGLQWQKQQAEAQMYGNILQTVLPFFIKQDQTPTMGLGEIATFLQLMQPQQQLPMQQPGGTQWYTDQPAGYEEDPELRRKTLYEEWGI